MSDLPTGTRGRILAVSLLLIPSLFLVKFGLIPLIAQYAEKSQEIDELQDNITRYRSVIAELPGLKANMVNFEQAQPLEPYLLSGSKPALAAAGLQRRLQQIAGEHNVRIVSVRVNSPADDGPLQRISVQARLSTDTKGLRNTLYVLEAGKPYLFVENLSVTARPRRRNTVSDDLEIRMTVSGLRAPAAQEIMEDFDG